MQWSQWLPVRKSPGIFSSGRRASEDPRIAGTGRSPPREGLPCSLAVNTRVMTRHRSHGDPCDRVIWWSRSTATKAAAMIAEGGYLQWSEEPMTAAVFFVFRIHISAGLSWPSGPCRRRKGFWRAALTGSVRYTFAPTFRSVRGLVWIESAAQGYRAYRRHHRTPRHGTE